MQNLLFKSTVVAAAVSAAPFALRAQNDDGSEWNHFGAEARAGFNLRAKFLNEGAVAAPLPPAAGGAVNRSYGDGFVNVDSSGNQGGLSWNWGYKNSSQVQGDNLVFNANAVGGASSIRHDDPNLGFEFNYVRDLAHEDWGAWGLKVSFGYTRVDLRDNAPHTADATLISDAYPLNGVQAPLAPYAGGFNGPGALLGSTPTRSVTSVPGGALVTGSRRLDADVYDFHLGPDASFRLTRDLSLELSAGLALGVVDGEFAFNESTATAAGVFAASGATRNSGMLLGVFGEAQLDYRLCRSGSVFVGVQFQHLGNFDQGAGGRAAQLDLSQTLFGLAGLRWSF